MKNDKSMVKNSSAHHVSITFHWYTKGNPERDYKDISFS